MSPSTVTYTSISSEDVPFWGICFFGMEQPDSLEAAPQSPGQAPPSPDYYPEYLVPSEDEAPMEDQPLPDDTSPAALSLGYIGDSDPEEDPKEDHADRGDDDDEYGLLVTYTPISSEDVPLWGIRFFSIEQPDSPEAAPQSLGPEHPPSLDYVLGPEHPPSPDYVPGPEHPPSPVYVPEPDPSLGYIADSDPEEDPEEDLADYPTDGGDDDDDESFDDDDDDVEEDEDDEEEEEHLAPADPFMVPVVVSVPSAGDTEAFEADESAPTPPLPRPRRARISVRLPLPMATSMEARIAEFASAPTPPSLPPSPLSPWSSPLPQIPSPPLPVSSPPLPLPSPPTSPTYAQAPLGYKADGIRLRVASPPTHQPSKIQSPLLLLPSTAHRDGIPKAEMPPRKRACLTTPAFGFKVGESSAAGAA
ncbi:hypothetical protein Tco_0401281 [Tanacetum coccineum]